MTKKYCTPETEKEERGPARFDLVDDLGEKRRESEEREMMKLKQVEQLHS